MPVIPKPSPEFPPVTITQSEIETMLALYGDCPAFWHQFRLEMESRGLKHRGTVKVDRKREDILFRLESFKDSVLQFRNYSVPPQPSS
jgi:hypothetical protein